MDKKSEELETQNNPEEETPEVVEEVETAEVATDKSISEDEIDDLKHKAEVSSQNFERAKKAEARVKELEAKLLDEDNDVLTEVEDEDDSDVKTELAEIKAELSRSKLLKNNPQLEEVWDRFEEFRDSPENSGMSMETAAKVFLVENDLTSKKRRGLETTTGGRKVPISSKMSSEDIANIRKNDHRKYRDMIKKGQIKFS